MKTLRMVVDFTYNSSMMYGDCEEGRDWFFNDILKSDDLTLHSLEVGDVVGAITVVFAEVDERNETIHIMKRETEK